MVANSTRQTVDLSVVIPTTVERDQDVDAIRYLQDCKYDDYEVIVRRDEGAVKARNEGIKRANADKIVFLDDDSMPRDGYLEAASKALEEHKAVTGRVLQPDDSPFKGKELPWYDQGDEPKRTELVAGCNMAMRKELLEAVGYFNEELYFGHEETELAERIRQRTYIYYNPEMVIDHYFAESVWDYWRKSYRHGKADVRWWRITNAPWRERLLLSFPLLIPQREDSVELISRFVKKFGRINGLLFDQ